MVYSSGLIPEYWRRYNQRLVTTGRVPTPGEREGLLGPMLAEEAANAERSWAHDLQSRQLSIQEKAAKDASRAASIYGVADIGLGATNLWLGKKYLDLLRNKVAMGTHGTTGAGTGLTGLPFVPPLTPPGSLSTFARGGAAGGGAGLTGGGAGAPILATETSFAPSVLAGETAAVTAPSAATGPGLASTIGLPAIGATALYAGGKYVSDKLGFEDHLGKIGGRGAGMALAPILAPTMLVADLAKGAWNAFKDLF